MKLRRTLAALTVAALIPLSACTQAERVSYNISEEADNFGVARRLAVVNTITNEPLFEVTGFLSIRKDIEDSQLEVTVKIDDDLYKKHFIGLTETVTYVVEDIKGTDVSEYGYQVTILPESLVTYEYKVR